MGQRNNDTVASGVKLQAAQRDELEREADEKGLALSGYLVEWWQKAR